MNKRFHNLQYRGKTVPALLALAVLIGVTSGPSAQRREMQKRVVRGDTLYTLLKPGDIPGIFEPEFITVAEAAESVFVADSTHTDGGQRFPRYFDQEPLMVVVGESEVKAYSAWHLDGHEVVNDYIDGGAITVTW